VECGKYSTAKNSNDASDIIIYVPSFSNGQQQQKMEPFQDLLCVIQDKYKIGYNGIYNPVPISEQPNQALPFNPGLKECVNFIQRD
jgi:hypothetical protein